MSGVSGYLLRVICGAAVCALVGAIAPEGPGHRLRRQTAGLFLLLTVLSPLTDVRLPKLDAEQFRAAGEQAAQEGERQAEQERNAIITEAVEAYICNEASQLGLALQVRVSLDGDGLPRTVELTGNVAVPEREKLSGWLEQELGLGEEAQIWTTLHQSSE